MKTEEAISPVVSTIMLVAICIIMAAIIGAFAFGIVGDTNEPRTVGFIVKTTALNEVTITNYGGDDIPTLEIVTVGINGNAATEWVGGNVIGATAKYTSLDGINSEITNHVVITGQFSDGSKQVLFDQWI